MSLEENYAFDVGGYLIVPGALKPSEIADLNTALDGADATFGLLSLLSSDRGPFRDLLVHPILVWYLNQICGPGFRLGEEPRLIGDSVGDPLVPLHGGNEPREPARTYYYQNGRRYCEAVEAVWALEDVGKNDGGLVLVPCSHKSNVETPEGVSSGISDMGLTVQPELKAGDLIILAGSLLRGLRPWTGSGPQRLLSYAYGSRGSILSSGTSSAASEEPETIPDLTPEQRAVLYKPGYRPTYPPPAIVSDGKTNRLSESSDVIHPSIYTHDPNTGIDLDEFYFWDLCGYLVLRNVLEKDNLELANEAIDRFEDQIVVGNELANGSKSLAGTGRPLLGGLLQLPEPYNQPFIRMVSHPAIVHRLTWMGGSGFRCGGPTAFCSVKGTSGHSLHDANEPLNPGRGYVFQNGRSYCEAVTVTWQLRDVTENDGGFACVPGSHKAQYRMPRGIRTCDEPMGLVAHPVMNAGDVLFFMDGAQTHGALAWTGDVARRGILTKYSSKNFNRSGGDMVHPENRWHPEAIDGMTDEQLSVMRGPDRDVFDGNVPRLAVENGSANVTYDRREGALYSKEAPSGPESPKD